MSWHDHPLYWKSVAKIKGLPYKDKPAECVKYLIEILGRDPASLNLASQIYNEHQWTLADRPYYDLYPSVAEAFTKVNLDKITCQQVKLPLPQLMIRFKVGHELQASPKTKIRSILAAEAPGVCGNRGLLVMINDGSLYENIVVHTINAVTLKKDTSIADHLRYGRENPYCDDDIDNEAVDNAYRLLMTLCLLKDNPDLIEAEPLEADKKRWEETHDPKLIAKAIKRGKRAWAIGKNIEVAPGFRTPHFAIRWMGKGTYEPVLRPIKGCLINRQKVEEVPTDWLGPE